MVFIKLINIHQELPTTTTAVYNKQKELSTNYYFGDLQFFANNTRSEIRRKNFFRHHARETN